MILNSKDKKKEGEKNNILNFYIKGKFFQFNSFYKLNEKKEFFLDKKNNV